MDEIERHTLGPKEWLPGAGKLRRALLPGDERRLLKLKAEAETGKRFDAADVLWLCGVAETLGRLSIFEFDFPDYAGLVNHVQSSAFALRFDSRRFIQQAKNLTPEDKAETVLLEHTVQTGVSGDVLMVIRPWIIPAQNTDPDIFGQFRTWSVSMRSDGEILFDQDSAEEHLANPDGGSLRRLPYLFPPKRNLFAAVLLDQKNDPVNPVADASRNFGYFFMNGTHLALSVRPGRPLEGNISLRSGFTAAVYTTRPF